MTFKLFNKNRLVEIIGILSIAGSLLFVGFEMRQSQLISSAEQDFFRAEINTELRNSINENIEIWSKGNAGEELDKLEAIIYTNMIKSSWDSAEALSQARDRLGSDAHVAIHQFSVFLHENSGAKTKWVALIEKEQASRALLQYNIPGFEDRIQLVLTDLEKLSQQ